MSTSVWRWQQCDAWRSPPRLLTSLGAPDHCPCAEDDAFTLGPVADGIDQGRWSRAREIVFGERGEFEDGSWTLSIVSPDASGIVAQRRTLEGISVVYRFRHDEAPYGIRLDTSLIAGVDAAG